MSENTNPVNAGQPAVVEPANGASEAAASTSVTTEAKAAPEVATQGKQEAKPKQSWEENSAFASLRRRAEAAEREAAQRKAEAERLSGLVGSQYGYAGGVTEVADQLEAAASGRDVSVVRAEREQRAAQDQRIAELEAELSQYQPLAVEQFKASLLADIKEIYPDVTAKSVDEFGEEFASLIGAGVKPATAYAAIQAQQQATTKPTPPEIGAVNSKTEAEPEYYTKEEVDRHRSDKNWIKKNYDKIRASMERW
jgi:hypothetical protein